MFLSMGKDTYKVSLKRVFAANRQRVVERLRQAAGHNNNNTVIYLQGGESVTRYDSDHEPLFRQESYFYYLTGVKEPDCSVVVDVATNQTTLLIPQLPAEYAIIMGRIKTRDEWKEEYQVDAVRFTSETNAILEQALLSGGGNSNNGKSKLLLMKGTNSDSGLEYKTPSVAQFSESLQKLVVVDDTEETLFEILAEARVTKSEAELKLLQHVSQVTSFAHAYVMRNMKPDMMEYQGESLFRHYCYYNYGCRLVGYTPICGCGPNAAILHYGHAGEPNARQSRDGDMCLFDMGAEYFGYGSDITCSFPINGKFTDKQRPIYQAVLNAQVAVYNMMEPGVSWVDCHKAAEKEILKVLAEIGIVVRSPEVANGKTSDAAKSLDELVEMRLGAVFMPHGLGHFIGIDTHDVGGYLSGHPERSPLPGLKSLRTARILQPSMTITVEPGCYFIDHLLDQALQEDSPLKPYLNKQRVDEYRGFGGVRLEDVVVVTASDGPINYTLCPRTIEEVESVMAGGKWPPRKDEAPELRRVSLTDPLLAFPLSAPPSV